MSIDWYTSTIVDYPDTIAWKQGYLDIIGKAAHSLIPRVVEYFPNEVMQAIRTCSTNIHSRPLSHRIKPLEYCDRVGSVCYFIFDLFPFNLRHISHPIIAIFPPKRKIF